MAKLSSHEDAAGRFVEPGSRESRLNKKFQKKSLHETSNPETDGDELCVLSTDMF